MKKTITSFAIALSMAASAQTVVADFETFTLSPNSAYSSTVSSQFQTTNAIFPFTWDTAYGGYWAGGFSYTNKYDTSTANYTNMFGVRAYKGYNNSNIYVVGKDRGVMKLKYPYNSFDGFYITNTTYAYFAMLNGNAFSRKFGDTTGAHTGTTVAQGSYPDFFKVTVKGFLNGIMKPDSTVFMLADYTFTNNAQDYIVKTWQYVNTSNLGTVDSVKFFMYSSDVGPYGINTPLFFAIDNLTSTNAYVGIAENSFSNKVSLYPNPFSDKLTINFNSSSIEKAEVRILDIAGKLIYSETLSRSGESINLSGLEKGAYFLELITDQKKTVKKLIKE